MKFTDPFTQLIDETNINKYKMGGVVVSNVLGELVKITTVGRLIYDICQLGDNLMIEELNKNYKDVKNKGIAFPTAVSINNVAGFFSPGPTDKTVINDGDLVKIELGVHIDGFPALIAHTIFVKEGEHIIDTEKKANVLNAVTEAGRLVFKSIKPGVTNKQIVSIIEDCAKKYECQIPVIGDVSLIRENINTPGVLSHQMSQYIIDGYNTDNEFNSNQDDNKNIEFIHHFLMPQNSSINNSERYGFSLQEDILEEDEVYAVDIVMCSGTGRLTKHSDSTIFKKIMNKKAMLKLQCSKGSLNYFKNNPFPINIKNNTDPKFKLGLKECVTKGLIDEYIPMKEKNGEYIARNKFTVIIKKKPILITGRSADDQLAKFSQV